MFDICELCECMWMLCECERNAFIGIGSGLCLTLDLVNGNAMSRFFFFSCLPWCVIFVAAALLLGIIEFGIVFGFIEHSRLFSIISSFLFCSHLILFIWHNDIDETRRFTENSVYFRCYLRSNLIADRFFLYFNKFNCEIRNNKYFIIILLWIVDVTQHNFY